MTGFELTAAEFDIVWHELGLGRMPYPLAVPSAEAAAGDRQRLTDQVRRAMRDRGLWYDTLDLKLAALLRMLAEPDRSVDAIAHHGVPLRALAAETRRRGVLATVDRAGTVRLAEIHPTTTIESIVDLLPDVRPGPGASMSVQVTALAEDPVATNDWQAADVRSLLTARIAGGQFGVTVTGRRAPTLINWFDTPQGRYLLVRDGNWLSLAPADNRRITRRLHQVTFPDQRELRNRR